VSRGTLLPLVLNGAPSQRDRAASADVDERAAVDARALPELLDFGAGLAALVNFYDLDDRPQGNWVEFFLRDPAIVLSAVAAFGASRRVEQVRTLAGETADAGPFGRKLALLRHTFAAVQAFGRAIDDWLRGLGHASPSPPARLLSRALEDAIEGGLGAELRRLCSWDRGAAGTQALGQAIGLDWSGFAPLWRLADVVPDGGIYRGRTRSRRVDAALPHLSSVVAAFAAPGPDLAVLAEKQLGASLDQPDHPPQSGLFIAFARLFAHAQRSANTIAPRYRDFYYRRVLREPPQGAVADSVDLTFVLAAEEGLARTSVPMGTAFPAGEEADGRERLYVSLRALAVGAASLQRLLTLRVLEGPLVVDAPTRSATLPVVPQRVFGSQIDPRAAGTPWPLFGPADASGSAGTSPARLGFAVASWCLLLTSGRRSVSLTVHYGTAYGDDVLWPLLDAAAEASGLTPAGVFASVLAQAFALRASTETGWFPVDAYTVELPPEPTSAWFRLRFELPAAAPPLAPVTDGEPDVLPAALPTLAVELRSAAAHLPSGGRLFAYSLLGRMPVERARIDAAVDGLGGLEIENTDGSVDPSLPFTLFGGVPSVGSFLRVRQRELFVKTPDSLRLALDWYALPPDADGFTGWYRDYTLGLDGRPPARPPLFDNASFRARLSVREPGTWTLTSAEDPGASAVEFALFEAKGQDGACVPAPSAPKGPLCPRTRLDDLVVHPAGRSDAYYDPARSALEVELTAPTYAFGADLYPVNVLGSVLEELPDREGCRKKCLATCEVLTEAADQVAVALAHCQDLEDPEYVECIRPRFRTLRTELVELAVPALLSCLGGEGAAPAADLRASAEAAEPSTCEPLLRRVVEGVRAVLRARGSTSVACAVCIALLEATLEVLVAASCQEKACVTTVVGEVIRQLKQAYDACLETCIADCTAAKPPLRYPKEPFLPQLAGVAVDYTAHAETPADVTFIQLLPFDGYRVTDPGAPLALLPAPPGKGSLYLGFGALAPPQELTLLLSLAQTGGDEAEPPPPVAWSCLSGGDWTELPEGSVGPDSTDGLTSTGILELALPPCDPSSGTVLPGGQQWLRATVSSRPEAFPDARAVVPHAVRATLRTANADGVPDVLPAHTISSSVEDLPGIGSIDQPLPSFDGRPAEDKAAYERRLSERLRHKQRAVLGWDYERLVLERFPSIWKAQVLSAQSVPDVPPGSVLLMVVPGPSSEAAHSTVPRASREVLGAVEEYLRPLMSPFVTLRVVNPVYVRTQARAWVAFAAGEDAGECTRRLDGELVRYLSPWYDGPERAARGGLYATADDVSSFIQSRPYVHALERLRLRHRPRRTSVPWCFLTSAASHEIHVVAGGAR
jgi:hypothetical protein